MLRRQEKPIIRRGRVNTIIIIGRLLANARRVLAAMAAVYAPHARRGVVAKQITMVIAGNMPSLARDIITLNFEGDGHIKWRKYDAHWLAKYRTASASCHLTMRS